MDNSFWCLQLETTTFSSLFGSISRMLWYWQHMVAGLVAQQLTNSYALPTDMPPDVVIAFDSGIVRKEFDGRAGTSNREAELNVEFIPGARLCLVGPRLSYVEYEYLGSAESVTGEHVAAILRHLSKVHERGICHGDIRLANMVFTDPAERSMLIDFDWSGKAGEKRYPMTFVRDLPDTTRHENAVQLGTLQLEHDRFSLSRTLQLLTLADDSNLATAWREFCMRIESSNESLESLAVAVSTFSGKLQLPASFRHCCPPPCVCLGGLPAD